MKSESWFLIYLTTWCQEFFYYDCVENTWLGTLDNIISRIFLLICVSLFSFYNFRWWRKHCRFSIGHQPHTRQYQLCCTFGKKICITVCQLNFTWLVTIMQCWYPIRSCFSWHVHASNRRYLKPVHSDLNAYRLLFFRKYEEWAAACPTGRNAETT